MLSRTTILFHPVPFTSLITSASILAFPASEQKTAEHADARDVRCVRTSGTTLPVGTEENAIRISADDTDVLEDGTNSNDAKSDK